MLQGGCRKMKRLCPRCYSDWTEAGDSLCAPCRFEQQMMKRIASKQSSGKNSSNRSPAAWWGPAGDDLNAEDRVGLHAVDSGDSDEDSALDPYSGHVGSGFPYKDHLDPIDWKRLEAMHDEGNEIDRTYATAEQDESLGVFNGTN